MKRDRETGESAEPFVLSPVHGRSNNRFDLTPRLVMVRAECWEHEPRQARVAGQAYVIWTESIKWKKMTCALMMV